MAHPPRRALVLASMSLVSALIWMPTSAIAVALPAVRDDLGSSFTELQWMINAYTLAVAALLVVMGRAGDLFGRRRVFLAGCAVFSVGALSAALAQSTAWLIVSVAVVGVGSAMAGPASLALVADAYPTDRQGWAIGIWGAASGVGSAAGPLVGGVLTQGINWRAVFWINVPLILVALIVAAVVCRESRAPAGTASLNLPGAVTFGAGLTALFLALGQGATWGWGSVGVVALFAAAAVLATSFIVTNLGGRGPLIPFRELASRPFAIAVTVLLLGNVVVAALLFALPLYLQNILDRSAIATGVVLLPATATLLVLSPISGVLTDRLGPRVPLVGGILTSALGVYLVSRLNAGSSAAALVPGLLVLGVGLGLQITPTNVVAVQAVPVALRATTGGLLHTTGMIGATLGIVAFGAVFGGIARADLPERLAAAGADVSEDEVETLDTVVTGSEKAQEALRGYSPAEAARIERAVDETFASAFRDVLVLGVALELVAALIAAGLPRRHAVGPAGAVAPVPASRGP